MSYQIKIAAVLDQSWSDWLGKVNMTTDQLQDGTRITTLTLETDDPAQLFGALDHLRDLNITLISVNKYNQSSE